MTWHEHVLVLTRVCGRVAADLGLSLLQQSLQTFLGGSALVVIAHNQDDVVPPELSHEVEPDLSLVRVGRHGPQEGQVDALRRETLGCDSCSHGGSVSHTLPCRSRWTCAWSARPPGSCRTQPCRTRALESGGRWTAEGD